MIEDHDQALREITAENVFNAIKVLNDAGIERACREDVLNKMKTIYIDNYDLLRRKLSGVLKVITLKSGLQSEDYLRDIPQIAKNHKPD